MNQVLGREECYRKIRGATGKCLMEKIWRWTKDLAPVADKALEFTCCSAWLFRDCIAENSERFCSDSDADKLHNLLAPTLNSWRSNDCQRYKDHLFACRNVTFVFYYAALLVLVGSIVIFVLPRANSNSKS